jgi:S1-C subfamily serine protease
VAALAGLVAAGLVALGTRLPQGARPTLSSAPAPQSAPSAPTAATAPTAPSLPSDASADDIAAAVDPGIVDVNTTLGFGQGEGAGTGMILSTSGLILTNNHVIDGATTISVRLVDTGRSYPATVVGTDDTDDVAVIKIDGVSGLKPIALGDSDTVAVGDAVVAIGNAGGVGGDPSVVTGTVTALDQSVTVSDEDGSNPENLSGLIQTNAPIQPGDSGGPLLNRSGQVIGINTAASVGGGRRFRASAAEGLTIPINQALTIAHQIEAGQASATIHIGLPGFLGVEIDPGQTAAGSGAPVVGVIPGSPAAAAGLGSGAVITSLDGQSIGSPDELTAATAAHHPGDKVALGWTDATGRAHHATVTLTSGPAS